MTITYFKEHLSAANEKNMDDGADLVGGQTQIYEIMFRIFPIDL